VTHSPSSIETAASDAATWQWHDADASDSGAYLTCSLLADFAHGFWSRQAYPKTPFDLTPVLATDAATYRTKQIHSAIVVASDDLAPIAAGQTSGFMEADGIVGLAENRALWTCSADCTPVAIGDVRTGAASAVHAGWRGTAAQIVPAAIGQLEARGSRREDLRFALGPAIDGAVYQVARSVGARVVKTLFGDAGADLDDAAAIDRVGFADRDRSESPLFRDSDPDRVKLDVRRTIVGQLRRAGISAEAIAVAPHCTFQEPDRFFSYRRTGEKFVQWSGIVTGLRS